MRHPRQACHHHAQGHPACPPYPWRACLSCRPPLPNEPIGLFQGHQTEQKENILPFTVRLIACSRRNSLWCKFLIDFSLLMLFFLLRNLQSVKTAAYQLVSMNQLQNSNFLPAESVALICSQRRHAQKVLARKTSTGQQNFFYFLCPRIQVDIWC